MQASNKKSKSKQHFEVNWKQHPPIIYHQVKHHLPGPVLDPMFIPPAQAYSKLEVKKWAQQKGMPEVAEALGKMHADGKTLLRTDAVKLQTYGVHDTRQALLGENAIRNLGCRDPGRDPPDSKLLSASAYRSFGKGEAPCQSCDPLTLLVTDPWRDMAVKSYSRVRDVNRQLWFGCPCDCFLKRQCLDSLN